MSIVLTRALYRWMARMGLWLLLPGYWIPPALLTSEANERCWTDLFGWRRRISNLGVLFSLSFSSFFFIIIFSCMCHTYPPPPHCIVPMAPLSFHFHFCKHAASYPNVSFYYTHTYLPTLPASSSLAPFHLLLHISFLVLSSCFLWVFEIIKYCTA